jgi:GDP-4-dehydro-6-deoxy-D-mannose reductase
LEGKSVKVLITGASGFVGRHLIDHLSGAAGKPPVKIFGTCFPEKPEHCADLCRQSPPVRLIHVDLRSADSVAELIKTVRPDRIFHLAAISHVRTSWDRRRETLETNLMGTFHLYEAVRLYAPKARILFVSSSDVYGYLKPKESARAFREKERNGVVSPYAFTKAGGELLSEFYAESENLDIVVARPFPHTGPGQTADFVCSDWARQIALIEKGKIAPVISVGNLRPRRDYSDVRDVVRAYGLLMKKGKRGEVYNVATGTAPALKRILRTLLSFSTRRIEVRVDPEKLRKADIPYLAGANTKVKARTGWEPRIPLEKTLRDLLEDWRKKVSS